MPALQCLLLAGFLLVGVSQWPLYNMALLLPAFVVGAPTSSCTVKSGISTNYVMVYFRLR